MSNDTELHGTGDLSGEADLPAGCFSSWLRCTRLGLIKENEAFVQCGECNACCASSYFIHIRPDETQTLTAIPKALLFPAPGLPKGNVLMGYNEHGCCPMLTGGKCSIYEHRSQTCRSYDCRIFTAAGIIPDEAEKALIARQVRRWKFSYPTGRDFELHQAVQVAAKFLQEHKEIFPAAFVPSNSTQLAVLAIEVYDVFLKYNEEYGKTGCVAAEIEAAKVKEVANGVMEASRKFEASRNPGR